MKLFGRRREEPVRGLPADGRAKIAGVELVGQRVRADLSGEGPEVLWRTEGEPPRKHSRCSRASTRWRWSRFVDQGVGSVEELATTMIPGPYWYFWWD